MTAKLRSLPLPRRLMMSPLAGQLLVRLHTTCCAGSFYLYSYSLVAGYGKPQLACAPISMQSCAAVGVMQFVRLMIIPSLASQCISHRLVMILLLLLLLFFFFFFFFFFF